jgi:hypothetical protein
MRGDPVENNEIGSLFPLAGLLILALPSSADQKRLNWVAKVIALIWPVIVSV